MVQKRWEVLFASKNIDQKCSGEDSNRQAKRWVCGTSIKSGTPGGTLAPNSDRYNAFCDLLTASGFTGAQLMLIDDALRETGLQISDMDEVPRRPRNGD